MRRIIPIAMQSREQAPRSFLEGERKRDSAYRSVAANQRDVITSVQKSGLHQLQCEGRFSCSRVAA